MIRSNRLLLSKLVKVVFCDCAVVVMLVVWAVLTKVLLGCCINRLLGSVIVSFGIWSIFFLVMNRLV